MRHIKEVDGRQHTVILMQVENEVGMSSDTRDHSPAANKAYEGRAQGADGLPSGPQGDPDSGVSAGVGGRGLQDLRNLEQVFGQSTATDEIFMAWNCARYVGKVAAAGKAEYPLPMYVNAALHRSTTIADVSRKPPETGSMAGRFALAAPWTTCWTSGEPGRRQSTCFRPTPTAQILSGRGAQDTADPRTRYT